MTRMAISAEMTDIKRGRSKVLFDADFCTSSFIDDNQMLLLSVFLCWALLHTVIGDEVHVSANDDRG